MSNVDVHSSSATALGQKTAITNARVFDGHKVGGPTTVVIDGDQIVSASKAEGARTVDAEGGILIPGLIDSHCHVDTEAKLKELPTYGITTALDMSEPISTVHDLKVLAGKDGYADYLSAGPAITFQTPSPPGTAKQWVEERVQAGCDYIKVFADSPFGHQPEVAEMAAVIAEARKVEKLTVAHATSRQGQQRAQDAQVDFITHVPLDEALDDNFVKTMVAEDRCAIPTLIMMKLTAKGKGDDEGKDPNPEPAGKGGIGKMDFSLASKSVKLMHHAGVPILAGDDHNTQPFTPANPALGQALHQELGLLVEAGLSPTEALRAATVTPAQRFRLRDRGSITPGRRADLVLLKEDPTVDIAHVGTIKQVWCNGVSWTPPLPEQDN